MNSYTTQKRRFNRFSNYAPVNLIFVIFKKGEAKIKNLNNFSLPIFAEIVYKMARKVKLSRSYTFVKNSLKFGSLLNKIIITLNVLCSG